jgi:hypothetical protein
MFLVAPSTESIFYHLLTKNLLDFQSELAKRTIQNLELNTPLRQTKALFSLPKLTAFLNQRNRMLGIYSNAYVGSTIPTPPNSVRHACFYGPGSFLINERYISSPSDLFYAVFPSI